jgi:hypothetical protein
MNLDVRFIARKYLESSDNCLHERLGCASIRMLITYRELRAVLGLLPWTSLIEVSVTWTRIRRNMSSRLVRTYRRLFQTICHIRLLSGHPLLDSRYSLRLCRGPSGLSHVLHLLVQEEREV